MSDNKPTAQEYLKNKGLTGVGTYGLLCTRPDKSHMHELMEDYADEKVKYYVEMAHKNWIREFKLNSILND
jgi:hypothetical protein